MSRNLKSILIGAAAAILVIVYPVYSMTKNWFDSQLYTAANIGYSQCQGDTLKTMAQAYVQGQSLNLAPMKVGDTTTTPRFISLQVCQQAVQQATKVTTSTK